MTLALLPMAIALAATAIGAVTDLRTGHIPNWLTLSGIALGLGSNAALHAREGARGAFTAFGFSLLGMLTCASIPLVLWLADENSILPGDIKMIAAVGALLRTLVGLEATFYAFIAAMIFAGARMAWEGKLLKTLGNSLTLVVNPLRPKDKRRTIEPAMMTSMRFGPFIFAGVLLEAMSVWMTKH
ncbi:MAG: prepilin peptidase [Polyangiales bacterium]